MSFNQYRTNPGQSVSNFKGRTDTPKAWPGFAVSKWMNGGLFGDGAIGDSWIIHSRSLQPNVANRFLNFGIGTDKYLIGTQVYGVNGKPSAAWYEVDSAGTLNAVSPQIYTTVSGQYGYPANETNIYMSPVVDSSGNWIVQFESENPSVYGKAANLVSLNSNLGLNYQRVWVQNGLNYYCRPQGSTLSSSGKVAISTTFRSPILPSNESFDILQYPASQATSPGQTKIWDVQLYPNNYTGSPFYNNIRGYGLFASYSNDVIFAVAQKGADPGFYQMQTQTIVKANSNGSKAYAKYYRKMKPGGSTPPSNCYVTGGCVDSSDNVYAMGYSNDNNGTNSYPIYHLKVDSAGAPQYWQEVRANPIFSGSNFSTADTGDVKADGSIHVQMGSGMAAQSDSQPSALVFIRNSSGTITAAYSIKCHKNSSGAQIRVDGEKSKITGNDLILTIGVHGPQQNASLIRLKDGCDGTFTGTSTIELTDSAGNNPYDATVTIAAFTAFSVINYTPGASGNYALAQWDTGSGGIAVSGSQIGGRSYGGTGNISPGSSGTAAQAYTDTQESAWQLKGIK